MDKQSIVIIPEIAKNWVIFTILEIGSSFLLKSEFNDFGNTFVLALHFMQINSHVNCS